MSRYILALDQGTTSTRAILFDRDANVVAQAAEPLAQIFPEPGWVEHCPDTIWRDALGVARRVLAGIDPADVAAIGIANQRETTLIWDRRTSEAIGNAIVWQDRRTAKLCARLRAEGLDPYVSEITGLTLDPYFSASKLSWMLDQDADLRRRAGEGDVCFGTVDSWLVHRLTAGRLHATDATNASRTLLFDIRAGAWDQALLDRFGAPAAMLPEVKDCQADFGESDPAFFGRPIPIRAIAGDQQAAAYGQACFEPGAVKATYGTGCFAVVNAGASRLASGTGMLGTILHQLGGVRTYALEGAIFMAGATIQWLRDALGLIATAGETEALAAAAQDSSGVYLVPAFQGLGAPFWDAEARGAILGLSRASSKAEIVRAALESTAFQTRDLLDAMAKDLEAAGLSMVANLRVDGGMCANRWFLQCLADLVGRRIELSKMAETTALGAAFHAGQAVGLYGAAAALSARWRSGETFEPRMAADERDERYAGWLDAVNRTHSIAAARDRLP